MSLHRVRESANCFRTQGYGFLETPGGREIYFHKNSVLDGGFGRLKIGTAVRFAEEEGEKGPQASTVRLAHSLSSRLKQILRRVQ